MAITAAQMRVNFPEFASNVKYSDGLVNFWIQWAYLLLDSCRWRQALDLGAQLYVAHNLSLEGLAGAEGANGAPPGMTVGPVVSKTVGELTVTYDVASGINEGDQHWALTNYGTRFIKFARQFGTGPVQTRPGRTPLGAGFGAPWAGPTFENWSG